MVELIKTEYPRRILRKIIKSIQEDISVAFIFGSYAKNSGKALTKESDIDFIIIFKPKTNPLPIVEQIQDRFEKLHIVYDIGWFTEQKFIKLLKSKIDLCLWWSLFKYGEILYAEQKFMHKIAAIFADSTPIDTKDATNRYRQDRIRKSAQSIARNLHRIVIDEIWISYYQVKGLERWNKLPEYSKLVEVALEDNIINISTAVLARQLEKLRKDLEKNCCEEDFKRIQSAFQSTNLLVLGS